MLLLSVIICTFTTVLLLIGVSSKWFYVAAFTSFAVFLTGGPVINFAFVREHQFFFLYMGNLFLCLAAYFKEGEGGAVSWQNVSPLDWQKFVAKLLIIAGLGLPILLDDILRVRWGLLDAQEQARSVLFIYIGIVGLFLLRWAHKKEEVLEPPSGS